MNSIDILKLEQRVNIQEEFEKIRVLFTGNYLRTENGFYTSLKEIVDSHFDTFEFVGTSRSFDEYLAERGVFYNEDEFAEYVLYYINAMLNFKNLLTMSKSIDVDLYSYNWIVLNDINNKNYFRKLDFHIDYLLENLNYKVYKLDFDFELGFEPVIVTKREPDIDSVLPLVDPPIALDILSFFDHRISNNLIEKESIIARLYKNVLEKDRRTLSSGGTGALFKDTKRIFNFIARHYNEETSLSKDKRLEFCNMAFTMLLHLIRSKEVNNFQKIVAGLSVEETSHT